MDFLISSLDLFCTGQFAKKNCSESFFRSFIVTFLVAVNHGMHSSQLSPSASAPPLFSAMVQTVQYPEWLHHRLQAVAPPSTVSPNRGWWKLPSTSPVWSCHPWSTSTLNGAGSTPTRLLRRTHTRKALYEFSLSLVQAKIQCKFFGFVQFLFTLQFSQFLTTNPRVQISFVCLTKARVKISCGSKTECLDIGPKYQSISNNKNESNNIMRVTEQVPATSNEAYDFYIRPWCVCFHISSEPHQGSFGSKPRPPLLLGLGPTVWSAPEFDGLHSRQPSIFFWFGSNQTKQVWIHP